MKNITVSNQSKKALTMTAFTFRFTSDVLIPAEAQILITYPQEITVNNSFTGCSLSNKNPNTQCNFNTDSNLVTITQVNDVPLNAGTVLSLTILGLINS